MFNDLDNLNGVQDKFLYRDLQDTDKASFNALIGKNKQGKNVSINFERTPHVLIRRCKREREKLFDELHHYKPIK